MNEMFNRRLKFYEDNYQMVCFRHLDKPKKFHVPAINPGRCRYCGRVKPDAVFSLEAHAFPELIGNKTLISSDECDDCNKFFSHTIEDNLAKFLGIQRTISKTKGKHGVPSYKSPDKQVRWEVNPDGKSIISSVIGNNSVVIDKDNKKLTITTIRQPHVRRLAYKCFVKMALSVMPESDLKNMKDTIAWVLAPIDNIQTNSFIALHTFVSGTAAFKHITFALFRRKQSIDTVPQYSFFIAWGSFTYQVFIPFSAGDKCILGKTLTLEYFPNVLDGASKYGNVAYTALDLSSNDLVRNDKNIITYSFEEVAESVLSP